MFSYVTENPSLIDSADNARIEKTRGVAKELKNKRYCNGNLNSTSTRIYKVDDF